MSAKDIIVKPIRSQDAARIVKACHYSRKVSPSSHLHFGVFMGGKCGGALQFGRAMQKSALISLVRDTKWHGFIELNRMAFADWLPRNSESRAISVAMRLIRKEYPQIEWVVSFADGTQCGDGTIYRASGFVLTAIKENSTIYEMPDGFKFADIGLRATSHDLKRRVGYKVGESFSRFCDRTGARKLKGFQLRYIYFLNPAAKDRLTVPILPFTEIQRRGAGMYRGKPTQSAGSDTKDTAADQAAKGGSTPTPALQPPES